jgi:hypothetical protein
MNDVKWEQYGAAGGVLFVILLLVAAFIPGSPPASDDSAQEIREFFVDNDTALKIAGYLNGVAILPFLFFLGSLWSRVRGAGDETRRLATTLAGGGVVSVSLASVSTAITAATAIRIEQINAEGVKFFFILGGTVVAMTAFGAAVLVGATSVAALRARLLPAWLGWAGLALTVAWLVAGVSVTTDSAGIGVIAFIVFLAFLVWVLVISFFLYRPQVAARVP